MKMKMGWRRPYRYSWNNFETLKVLQNLASFSRRERYVSGKRNKTGWMWLSAIISGICAFSYIRSSRSKVHCDQEETYQRAIDKSREILRRRKDEVGAPGIVIGISINGKTVWQEGLGYADVENRVPCTENTVMRIASISKSLTMAAVAKLWEDGKLDLDKPVKEYVPYFPEKTFEGKKVDITCRHLVSHLSGIRHYDKKGLEKDAEKPDSKAKKEEKNKAVKDEISKKNESDQRSEFELKEYFIKEKYESVKASLDLFKDDPLVHKPGTKFLYTTHGWTLLSAVVEALAEKPFAKFMCQLFKDFGMTNTYLDTNDAIIYHRARFYCRDKKGHLQNTPYVDNSYKWAGGGFLSTVGDLLRFGNIMLYSLQHKAKELERSINQSNEFQKSENNGSSSEISTSSQTNKICCNKNTGNSEMTVNTLPGYLKDETVQMIWLPVENATPNWEGGMKYGMGWGIVSQKQECAYCREENFHVLHTGGAIGASSVLLILPRQCGNTNVVDCRWECPPQGIIVTIITNLQAVGLAKTATQIAKIFQESMK